VILYLDTSSLVKLYLDEVSSDTVRAWCEDADLVATTVIAYPEAMATLARRWRQGDLSREALDELASRLGEEWSTLLTLAVDEGAAGELPLRHALRGLDAIHVAAALTLLRDATPGVEVQFSSFDRRQCDAARAEGLVLLEPPGESA